jgi:UDP-glucose 4-epimerase
MAIITRTDEIRNEEIYWDTKQRRWVDPEEMIAEPDNFEMEDEAE